MDGVRPAEQGRPGWPASDAAGLLRMAAPCDDHLGVDSFAVLVADVGLHGRERGQLATLHDVGLFMIGVDGPGSGLLPAVPRTCPRVPRRIERELRDRRIGKASAADDDEKRGDGSEVAFADAGMGEDVVKGLDDGWAALVRAFEHDRQHSTIVREQLLRGGADR